ncbi:hypothetical protein C8F04DRAFT_65242 [Mycena alexandri]|uniref:Secreted protein n=1 Tax=Mycena alexandri TaxID=1745969 RepID=A0AAD6SJB4_9AGAR|nr:hypothetical protein C8F04DRAFT_65242 [Mycena alexandri]
MHQLQILLLFSLACFAGSGLNTQQINTLPLCGVLETVGRKLDCFLPTSMGPNSVPVVTPPLAAMLITATHRNSAPIMTVAVRDGCMKHTIMFLSPRMSPCVQCSCVQRPR